MGYCYGILYNYNIYLVLRFFLRFIIFLGIMNIILFFCDISYDIIE